MSDAPRSNSRRPRVILVIAFAAVLAAGVGLGVLLDRHYLRPDRGPDRPASDPRLIGRWVRDDDQTPLEFKSDGTFEYVRVTTFDVPVFGDRSDDIKTEKKKREEPVTGQYRWVNGETIEIQEPDLGRFWFTARIAIEGDRLTLLAKDGGVRRYTRAK